MITLLGSVCVDCSEVFCPPGYRCPRCGGRLADQTFSGKGDVYSYAWFRLPNPVTGESDNRIIAHVHLAEGAYLSAILVGVAPHDIFIGMPIEASTEPALENDWDIMYQYHVLASDAAPGQMLVFRPRRSLVE